MTHRVLVIGLGSIGRRHLQVIRAVMPQAKVMVLRHAPVTEDAELADLTTASFSEVRAFQPEMAVLANPATLHSEMAQPLLAMGCHLLIEKPLAANAQDGQAILAAARAAGRLCQVGYNLRYLPSLQAFRDQIHQESIGRAISIRCEVGQFLGSWREGTDYRQGVSSRREMGGGVLLELSHELDYLAWIFGKVEWVSAWVGRQSKLEIDVEDTAHMVLGFQASEGASPVASVGLDFIRHDTTRRCVVIGEIGSLAWDAIRGTVEICLQGDTGWRLLHQSTHDRDFSYKNQWEEFLSTVTSENGSKNSLVASCEQALHVLHVVEAARNSATQQSVRVETPIGTQHG